MWLIDACIDPSQPQYALMVTKRGYSKRTPIEEFTSINRGGKGVSAIKFKHELVRRVKTPSKSKKTRKQPSSQIDTISDTKTGAVSGSDITSLDVLQCLRVCKPGDEVVVSTSKGVIIRSRASEISAQSRQGSGVLLQKLDLDDDISMLDVVPETRQQ